MQSHLPAALFVLVLASACAPGPPAVPGQDTTADTPQLADAEPDAEAPDTVSPDATVDALPDTVADVPPDSAPDSGPDNDAQPETADVLCPNGFVSIDFPCQQEFECLGNYTFRKNKTRSCQDEGYDPKCCSGATCQFGGVESCPADSLCVQGSWGNGACLPKNCGGPGGASCPAGETCLPPHGSCDSTVTKGVCVQDAFAAGLPACVTCESDCAGESVYCDDGKGAICKEVGGCFKVESFNCSPDKVCAGSGLCVPPTGGQGMPCGPAGQCTKGSQCLGAGASAPGYCSKPCGTCGGGTCIPLGNGCMGFGPDGDGQCAGPVKIGSQEVPVCAMPCTAKGQCPAGLVCKTVALALQSGTFAACLTPGL